MDKLNDLKDLLTHELHDLFSAEDQIIEALPAMIAKATNPELKKALKEHLRITEMQRKRLDHVNELLAVPDKNEKGFEGKVSSFLVKLFGNDVHKCKGMEGLISEGNKIMALEMNPEVLDAAIISCAQKIEHYEICSYGTVLAFAKELNLGNIAILLKETLDEEYAADDFLSKLAIGGLNEKAEKAEKAEMPGKTQKSFKTPKSPQAPAKDRDLDTEEDFDFERPKKVTGAKAFYGGGHGSKKPAADKTANTRGPKKNTSPNRRQVAPKGADAEKQSTGRGSGGRPEGGRPHNTGNKRPPAAVKTGGGRAQAGPKSKGRSTGGGGRGGAKTGGGGSRGHK